MKKFPAKYRHRHTIHGIYIASKFNENKPVHVSLCCGIECDSNGLTAAKIAIKIHVHYRYYNHRNLNRSCLLIYGITITFIS